MIGLANTQPYRNTSQLYVTLTIGIYWRLCTFWPNQICSEIFSNCVTKIFTSHQLSLNLSKIPKNSLDSKSASVLDVSVSFYLWKNGSTDIRAVLVLNKTNYQPSMPEQPWYELMDTPRHRLIRISKPLSNYFLNPGEYQMKGFTWQTMLRRKILPIVAGVCVATVLQTVSRF